VPAEQPAARTRTSSGPVRVDRSGPVTTVIINRPEVRNAVDGPTAGALAEAFADFEADADAAVAVLCGANGTFCAGADLKAVGTPRGNRTEPDGPGPMGPTRMQLTKPVIAAVAGYAVAGGLELALWCDLRVAEEDAVFGVFCRRWGVPLIDGGTVRLAQIVGLGRALDLILTGRAVEAAEAAQMGLVSRVVPTGGAREEAERLGAQIAAFPQACMRSDRASTLQALSLSPAEAMANEFRHGMATLADPAVIAGVSRFRGGAGRGGAPA
jgi:enoyl-CoA hydratase